METLTRFARRQAERNPPVERALLALAVVVFVTATVVAIFNLPEIEDGLRLPPLILLVLVAVPFTVIWNAVEYSFSARLVRLCVPIREAARVSVLSSAANLLPVPGAAIIRTRALSQLGTGYGRAAGSTAIVGLGWVATSFVAAGFAITISGQALIGIVAVVVGLLGLAIVAAVVRTRLSVDHPGRTLTTLVIIEFGFVAVLGLRMWLTLLALGYGGLDRGLALALAAVTATAAGFFPGGLGLREVLAGALSPVVGLPVTVGVVASVIDRVAGLVVLAMIGTTMSLLGYGVRHMPDATSERGSR